jgi:hypothetical protein
VFFIAGIKSQLRKILAVSYVIEQLRTPADEPRSEIERGISLLGVSRDVEKSAGTMSKNTEKGVMLSGIWSIEFSWPEGDRLDRRVGRPEV